MSNDEQNTRGRSASGGMSSSGLRRRNVQRSADDSVLSAPPRRQAPSQLDQHHAAQRTQASRVSLISSATTFAVPRIASALIPSVALARNMQSATTSTRDAIDHIAQGEVRLASASALSATGSALALAHVPVVPQVLSTASALLSAPETVRQHQGAVASGISAARGSSLVPQSLSAMANKAFKKTIGKQD